MAAPSENWTVIAAADTDADSPVDATLIEAIRENLIHSDERIGIPVAPADRQANHAHAGLDVDGSAPLASPYTIFTWRVPDADAAQKDSYGSWVSITGMSCYFGSGLDTARMAFRYAEAGAGTSSVRLVIDGTNYAFDTGLNSSSFTWVNSAITADISAMAGRPKWATVTFQFQAVGGSSFLTLSGLNITLTA